jgi:hypothetical protein
MGASGESQTTPHEQTPRTPTEHRCNNGGESVDFVHYLSRRPKCAIRRMPPSKLRSAARSYELNRKTIAAANALVYVESLWTA